MLQRQRTDLDRRTLTRLEREAALLRSRLATARKRLRDSQRLARSGHLPASELLALADETSTRALALSDKEQSAERIRSAIATAGTRLARLAASKDRDRADTRERLHDLRMQASRIRGSGFGFVLAPGDGMIASLRSTPFRTSAMGLSRGRLSRYSRRPGKRSRTVSPCFGWTWRSPTGGGSTRAASARSVYRNPRILILDEATAHLNDALQQRLLANLRRLPVTIVSVTYDSRILDQADRIVRLGNDLS